MAVGLAFLLIQTARAPGNPTGGVVTAGSASISSAGNTLTINQATGAAIINWAQFSINGGELTKFIVPASGATLNRVALGNISYIYGTLQSNGKVFLINPSGIVVGPGGRIDTAGFIGSTLDVSDDEFLKGGDLHFIGTADGSIDNEGVIHASNGDVYLIANQVTNGGKLSAPRGNVGLAAGTDVLFQQAGDQHLFVQASNPSTPRATGVTNSGTILAATAELKAAGGNAYALAINNTGQITANGYRKINGQVYLTSDGGDITNAGQISAQNPNGDGGTIVLNGHGTSSVGTVLNSGKLVASGNGTGNIGGTVEVLGNQVGIIDNGLVDVSGDAGGGTALIGGDEHGSNPDVVDADQTYLGPDATITADAFTLGNGGKIILWGDETTQTYGTISAQGGAQGGNGGFVETSAPSLDVQTSPKLSAPNGSGGTWLLDPYDLTISGSGTTVGYDYTAPFAETSGPANLNVGDLQGALNGTGVTVSINTQNGTGGTGNITWGGGATLTTDNINNGTLILTGPGEILFNTAVITGTGSLNLTLNSTTSPTSSSTFGNVVIESSTINLGGGNLSIAGTGKVDSTDPPYVDGVNIFGNSQINAGGGNIFISGAVFNTATAVTGGYFGVFVEHSTVQTSGTGTLTVVGAVGTSSAPMAANTQLEAVGLNFFDADTATNLLQTVDGELSITGTVFGTVTAGGLGTSSFQQITGVDVRNNTHVTTTGLGSVVITGDTSGGTTLNQNAGVAIGSGGTVGVGATSTGITITGTAGGISGAVTDINGAPLVTNTSSNGLEILQGGSVTALGTAPITLIGTGGNNVNTGLTNGDDSEGISLDVSSSGQNNLVSSASGDISLIGTGGSSFEGTEGIDLNSSDGGSSSITSSSGNISLTGFLPNQGSVVQVDNLSGNDGDAAIELGGDDSAGSVTHVTASAGSIYMAGLITSGIDNTKEAGIIIHNGAQVQASGTGGSAGATAQGDVTLLGDTTLSTAQSINAGVIVEGNNTLVSASGVAADAEGGTGLTITGTSTTIDGTTGTTIDNNGGGVAFEPMTVGVAVINGAEIQTAGSAPMTLNGTGGTNSNTLDSGNGFVSASNGGTSASYGVAVFSPVSSQTTTLSSGGLLSITGFAGSSPTTGIGVALGGPGNAGAVSVKSAGAIAITGTGGAGNTRDAGAIPNSGVAIFNPGNATGTVNIQANGGALTIIGTAGTGGLTAINGTYYFNSVYTTGSNFPTISALGNMTVHSLGGDINFISQSQVANAIFISPTGTSSTLTYDDTGNAPLALNGGDYTVNELAPVTEWAATDVTDLTITDNTNSPVSTNLAAITTGGLNVNIMGALNINGAIQAAAPVTLVDTGNNITFGSGGSISDSGSGNNVVLAAGTAFVSGYNIINDSANAIQATGGSQFYLYSLPTGDVLGGLATPSNVVNNAIYPTTGLPAANENLFYGSGSPSSPTPPAPPAPPAPILPSPGGGNGGIAGFGSTPEPPAVVPTTTTITQTPVETGAENPQNGGVQPPPITFTGNGGVDQGASQTGGMADSSGNGGQVGSGDAVQLNKGQMNNVTNPAAAGALGAALSPAVYNALNDAMKNLGNFTDAGSPGANDTASSEPDKRKEKIVDSGGVVEIDSSGVKSIPLNDAPQTLKNALADNSGGMQPKAAH